MAPQPVRFRKQPFALTHLRYIPPCGQINSHELLKDKLRLFLPQHPPEQNNGSKAVGDNRSFRRGAELANAFKEFRYEPGNDHQEKREKISVFLTCKKYPPANS